MWDTCAVELKVNLPRPVAAEIEEVQRRDPEMLSRILFYAMTQRRIFDHLAAQRPRDRDDRVLDETRRVDLA
jgi:hypothetical protein